MSDRERYGYAWLQITGQNQENGIREMKALSDKGFVEATIVLAMFAVDDAERKRLYKVAADQNHPEGLWGYSGFLTHAFVPDPSNPADAEWEMCCLKAAQQGSVDAMNELGNIFNRRNQFPQSMYWYAMANAHDFPNGEVSLQGIAKKWLSAGKPYVFEESGWFTEAKYKCALFYLEMWADQTITTSIDEYVAMVLAGEPLAAYLTGDMFEATGNAEMAERMYNAIAFENDAHGIRCYADMHFSGRGVEKNTKRALDAYNRAAELGERTAMFVVGELTKSTTPLLAAYWYGVSYTRGYRPALQRLMMLASTKPAPPVEKAPAAVSEENVVFCGACGQKLPITANFCSRCGSKIVK